MIITDRVLNTYQVDGMMAIAREHMKVGKKVMFAYDDLRHGISLLFKYFPNSLIEVVGSRGLVVWERKK